MTPRLLQLAALLGGATAGGIAAEALPAGGRAYDDFVAPILLARCVECHGPDKQKAKLALHTWEALARGSDAGPVIVAGRPAASPLVQRLKLPLDDEEHMPPADHPQPAAEEIALLEHWIARGASREVRVAELALTGPLAGALAQLPARLAALRPATVPEVRWELDSGAVAAARAPLADQVAVVQRRFPGALEYESRTGTTLHFTAAGLGSDFGDAELAALEPLRGQIVALDLSGSGVTDASAGLLGQFASLRVLRAAFTRLGDPTATVLGTLPALESLTLHATQVTAASVDAFRRLPRLRALRLGGTPAEEPARAARLPVGPKAAESPAPLPSTGQP